MDAEEKKNGLPLSDDTQEIDETKHTTADVPEPENAENAENQTDLASQDQAAAENAEDAETSEAKEEAKTDSEETPEEAASSDEAENDTEKSSDKDEDETEDNPEAVAKARLQDQATAMRDAAPETPSSDEKSGLTAPEDDETAAQSETAEMPENSNETEASVEKSESTEKPAGKTLDLNADEPDQAEDASQNDDKDNHQKTAYQQEKPPKQPKQQASAAAAKPKKSKKGLITAVVIIAALAIIYFAGAAFYHTHFYMNRKINGIDVGNQSVNAVASKIKNKADTYRLILKEKNDRTEKITSDALGIKYEGDDALRKLLNDQNPFIWPAALTGRGSVVTGSVISVDDSKLNLVVDSLNSVTGEDVVKAQNAQPVVGNDGQVTIKKEVSGNQIDTKTLKKVIKQTVAAGDSTVNLETQKCYVQPKYTSDSPAVKQAQQDMEKLTKASVTYTFGSDKVVVDSKVYGDWLTVDKNMKVTLDDDKLKDYLYQLALKTNTYYGKHTFKTTGGSTITVNGGNYGYRIDRDAEAKQLKEEILAGKTVTRDPNYSRKGKVRKSMYDDIGDSYVEVSIGSQHMWVYKDGNKVVDTAVVTGNVSAGNGTTPGAYYIAYKQRNAVLRGANYATPVSYWMPFNGGQGIHDSPWRGAYGGTIYRGGGSHGCVNTPPSEVPKVYANVEAGTPVIVY